MSDATLAIPVSNDLPASRAGRYSLLGRFVARDLSRLLILILIVLSPLTFSNNSIPNFQPDCETSYSTSANSTRKVAVARPAKIQVIAIANDLVVSSPQTPFFLPHVTPICSSQTSRAPPA